ncbi:hypothetical protein BJX99DRAFT_243775 [Aspergillus californicus]
MNSNRPYSCTDCSKSFTRSENLQRHRRARHDGTSRKSFECAGCHARFSRSDVYKRHNNRCQLLASQRQKQPDSQEMPSPMELVPDASLVVSESAWQTEQLMFEDETSHAHSGSPLSMFVLPVYHAHDPPAHVGLLNVLPTNQPNFWSRTNEANTSSNVKAYFEHFHPSFPLLHRPTFTTSTAPEVLVNIAAVIGSLYSAQSWGTDDWEACRNWRRDTWKNGIEDLRRLVAADYSEFRKTWVIQTWLLHIIFGAYMKESPEFEEAKRMLRNIVDAVREIGLLRQGIAMPDSLSWTSQGDTSDAITPYTRWMSYVNTESLKMSLYGLVFLDSHVFLPSNTRPLISPMEFGWELPFPSNVWDAKNPQVWLQRVTEHFGMVPENFMYGPRGIATASLSIATQQLMTESNSPELIAALSASPFTTLCVLTNINALIRDFTQCYYQMPPSPSDPSAFHILTQGQNKLIYSAMRAIAKIVKDQDYNSDNPQFLLWRTVEIFHCSVKISLCRPDHLLIGGIVDNSIIAGLATSTHLTLGNYVAVRRSAPLLPPHLWGDEGVLAVLNDLASVLSKISSEEGQCASREAPWVTACSYGVLLCTWAALRRASKDIQTHLDTFNELPRTSESCMLIFNTLIESVILSLGGQDGHPMGRDPRIWSTDRSLFGSLLEQGEILFVSLLQKICRDRYLWGIGPSMVTVVDEILTEPQVTTALA